MNKRKGSIFGILVLIALIIYFSFIIIDQQKMLKIKETALMEIENKIKKEELVRNDLEKQKDMLNSREYIEKVAREKLGMVKPGEKIFIDINK
ncbi:MAG TPA: septum formation initiator family protein [Clostridiales bacterium]|nr:septum formation initiator family protein [Clostridiales bacterium]